MAKYLPKTQSRKPKISSFLGCFGYSFERFPRNQSASKKNKVGCWLKIRSKKSVAKTVPVDGSSSTTKTKTKTKTTTTTTVDSEKADAEKKSDGSKSSWKRKSDEKLPTRGLSWVAAPKTMKTRKFSSDGLRKTKSRTAQNSALENGKILDKADSTKNRTCQIKQLLSQKMMDDVVKSESSRPASPNHAKPKTIQINSVSSLPPPRTDSRALNSVAAPPQRIHSKKNRQEETSGKRLDPLVGMSVILVTLIIMVLWGRLCAILCTSGWFYFLPKLRSLMMRSDGAPADGPNNPNSHDYLDLNSEEYKKKVILEGFLERNRRSSSL